MAQQRLRSGCIVGEYTGRVCPAAHEGSYAARLLYPGPEDGGEVEFGGALDGDADYSSSCCADDAWPEWRDGPLHVCVDAEREGTEVRFANDFRGIAPRPNAELCAMRVGHRVRLLLVTVADVREGQELLVDYGKGYWR